MQKKYMLEQTWRDWVPKLNSRLSFYYRLAAIEKCLGKAWYKYIYVYVCINVFVYIHNTYVYNLSMHNNIYNDNVDVYSINICVCVSYI